MEGFGILYELPLKDVVIGIITLVFAISYLGMPILVWTLLAAAVLYGFAATQTAWIIFAVIAVIANIPFVRRIFFTGPTFMLLKKLNILPAISATEKIAIEAGNVWMDGELFSGSPNFKTLFSQPEAKLTKDEQAFMDKQVKKVCEMTSDWEAFQKRDLPKEVWDYLKKEKFFGMIIPKEYGGLGFSAHAHSEVISTLATRSTALSITVMVPNSLGPGELLSHYGTEAQKKHYLPRLAVGTDLPAFALTEPLAGSDAGAIQAHGEVIKKKDGELYLKLNWEKRYITLAAISTVLGLAFKLTDPNEYLGKGKDLGITCALVPTKTKGVTLGKRHDPLGVPFYNCPTTGEDVEVKLEDAIIGGAEGAGRGWLMLMESLAAGRGISLPATSTGGAKLVSRVTGAYTAIRSQFGLNIGKFEGIAEFMGEIGAMTYMLDATRTYTTGGLDGGAKPPVVTALMKYMFTEQFRILINHGMDILGGAAISRGPRNLFAHPYIGTPISVTVEGANILTRTLMVFGQGAIRCHPYARAEIEAIENNDVVAFDKAFVGHIGHVSKNKTRAFLLSLTRGHLSGGTGKHRLTKKYTKKLSWVSASFAFWADMAMGTMGGELKRREMLTGNFADILAWSYFGMATLKRFEKEGCLKADEIYVEWAMEHALYKMQIAFDNIFANMAGWTKPILVWSRFNALSSGPSHALSVKVANAMQVSGQNRDRLTEGVFISKDKNDPLKRYEDTLLALEEAEPIFKKVKKAQRKKVIPKGPVVSVLAQAVKEGVIDKKESTQLKKAETMRHDAIMVDSFTLDQYLKRSLETAD